MCSSNDELDVSCIDSFILGKDSGPGPSVFGMNCNWNTLSLEVHLVSKFGIPRSVLKEQPPSVTSPSVSVLSAVK